MTVIVDYGMGNVGSIANMIRRVGGQSEISADPAVIAAADRLILPGVGAFDNGMRNIEERGLRSVLEQQVFNRGIPVLGLCLGMQLLTRSSEEGERPGLGWLPARTVRFQFQGGPADALKVPHMGWNTVSVPRPHPLFYGLENPAPRFYFVHSYYVVSEGQDNVLGLTTYGHEFVSAIGRDNIAGVQFHPEKSHSFGKGLLANFLERW